MTPRLLRPARPRALLLTLATVLALGLAAAIVFRNPWFRGNAGVVDAGLVYRGAQPIGEWPDLVARLKLATVLNLRGGSPSDPWYAAEVEATRKLGLAFYDFPLSATSRPSRKQLLTLLDLLDRCRYPLLIHCKSGSDRTGLVSGLYLMSRKGQPPEVAERAFSVYYGHIPLAGTRHLHEPFREYADWLHGHGLPHSPVRFRVWVAHQYPSENALDSLTPLTTGPRDRRSVRASARADGSAPR